MPWQYAGNGKIKSAERTVKVNSLIRILFLGYQLFLYVFNKSGLNQKYPPQSPFTKGGSRRNARIIEMLLVFLVTLLLRLPEQQLLTAQ